MSCEAHFWIIEENRGTTSTGRCKYCGEVREFRNNLFEGKATGYVPDSLKGNKIKRKHRKVKS